MMIVDQAIEAYLLTHAPERSSLLQALEANPPAAIVGPLEGQLLSLLVQISGSRRILEIGTAVGYSTLWLALGLAEREGAIVTIEQDRARVEEARENFARAGYGSLITVLQGDALDLLPTLTGPFDFIFVDILRHFSRAEQAPQLFDRCLPLLAPGGLLVADNVLVDGEVVAADPSPRAQGIREWNRRLAAEMDATILPLRDGVAIGRRRHGRSSPELRGS